MCCSSVGYAIAVMPGDLSEQPHRYIEIDVSEWNLYGEEVLGTKPKRWLIRPDTQERLWLMKDATFNTLGDGSKYRKGDDWAERIAYGVAVALGLPAARVELCVDGRGHTAVFGTICRSVLGPAEDLVLGNELLAEHGIHVTVDDRRSYTVAAIHRTLEDYPSPPGANGSSAWGVFVGYLVLDALIGNTDRHEENWAVIVSESGRYLAPTFDHASSLGFLLSNAQRLERMSSKDHNYTPEAFADRARTKFRARPHPIDAVVEARMLGGGDATEHWLNQLPGIEDLVAPIWAIPEHRMSMLARKFAERVMRRNWERLTGSNAR